MGAPVVLVMRLNTEKEGLDKPSVTVSMKHFLYSVIKVRVENVNVNTILHGGEPNDVIAHMIRLGEIRIKRYSCQGFFCLLDHLKASISYRRTVIRNPVIFEAEIVKLLWRQPGLIPRIKAWNPPALKHLFIPLLAIADYILRFGGLGYHF